MLALLSCKGKNNSVTKGNKALARVYDRQLYLSDISDMIPKGISKEDSASLVSRYVEQWVNEELVLKQAENNLADEQKNIEREIENYRKDLLIHRFQTELINQKLDTTVSDEEIEKYYNMNLSSFMLKDNIVKVRYVKVPKNLKGIEKVRKWYSSSNEKDLENLQGFCIQFADNFYLDENNWLLLDDLMKEIPIKDYSPELLLKTNKNLEISDSLSTYFLSIRNFKIKNSVSPIAFEKENIKNVIINKRKIDLIEDLRKNLYQSATENKNFEIYK